MKLRKSTQLQLRTLFQAYKKLTAEAAYAASVRDPSSHDPPPPPPRVPIIEVRLRVLRGAMKSAYMAVNKPFPSKSRHTWIWTPGVKKKRRKEAKSAIRTPGHQLYDDGVTVDESLGPTGCIFDMQAASTNYFAHNQYYLTIDGASSPDGGITEVEVTARVTMRTLIPPSKQVGNLKSAGIKTAAELVALEEKARLYAQKQAEKKRQQLEEEEKRLADLEEERRRRDIEEEEEVDRRLEKLRQLQQQQQRDNSQSDPFGADNPDRRYSTSAARVLDMNSARDSANDPLAGLDSDRTYNSQRSDPFGDSREDSYRLQQRRLDPFDLTPPVSDRQTLDNQANDLDSARTDVLGDEPSVTRVPIRDVLADLSNRTTPKLQPTSADALSQQPTPTLQPIQPNEHVLDGLSDRTLQPAPSSSVIPLVQDPAQLSVPLESLTPNILPRKIDVLTHIPTPRLDSSQQEPPSQPLSRLPSPQMRPKADGGILDQVPTQHLLPSSDPRVLDSLPTPKLVPQSSSSSPSLDQLPSTPFPIHPVHLPVRTGEPVDAAEVDAFLNAPDERARKSNKLKNSVQRPLQPVTNANSGLPPRPPNNRLTSIRPVHTRSDSLSNLPTPPMGSRPQPNTIPTVPPLLLPSSTPSSSSNPLDDLSSDRSNRNVQNKTTDPFDDNALFDTPTIAPSANLSTVNRPIQASTSSNPLDELSDDDADPNQSRPQYDLNVLDDL